MDGEMLWKIYRYQVGVGRIFPANKEMVQRRRIHLKRRGITDWIQSEHFKYDNSVFVIIPIFMHEEIYREMLASPKWGCASCVVDFVGFLPPSRLCIMET